MTDNFEKELAKNAKNFGIVAVKVWTTLRFIKGL